MRSAPAACSSRPRTRAKHSQITACASGRSLAALPFILCDAQCTSGKLKQAKSKDKSQLLVAVTFAALPFVLRDAQCISGKLKQAKKKDKSKGISRVNELKQKSVEREPPGP